MDIEKLKQIKTLVEECIAEYQGEDDSEMGMEMEEESSPDTSDSMSGNDKIKMAVAAMRRASK